MVYDFQSQIDNVNNSDSSIDNSISSLSMLHRGASLLIIFVILPVDGQVNFPLNEAVAEWQVVMNKFLPESVLPEVKIYQPSRNS